MKTHLARLSLALLCCAACAPAALSRAVSGSASAAENPGLMPWPAQLEQRTGELTIDRDFAVVTTGAVDERLTAAVSRALTRIEQRTGLEFRRDARGGYLPGDDRAPARLRIECGASAAAVPALGEDESYEFEADQTAAVLRAPTTLGVLRGLETFQQLLQPAPGGWRVPAVRIVDHPRFPWRGLMIDVCRHWQPIEVIKRHLDCMALVKLNVLHLHLTEDQGFRIESRKYPRLHELGSDGQYFTQEQMREIVAYAAARGIRVMPEFDVPGHATSWLVAYPELASGPGPYVIERRWSIFDPVFDPTNEKVYELLDGFFGEMAALFPDAYVHIGGDENNGKQWNANPRIQAFIREHGLRDNAGLHAHFNRRIHAILARHGKQLMGWEEILHPDLPKGSIVHSWHGADSLAASARQGYGVVLSKGYYINLMQPTTAHYANDPLPEASPLTAEEQRFILGGEATMWTEWASAETIDSRIWPRTAVIAERLWSPRAVANPADMFLRMEIVSRHLEDAGSLHLKNQDGMLRRFAGLEVAADTLAHLRTLVDAIEPAYLGRRQRLQPDVTQFTPLTGLVDIARPDSAAARGFEQAVGRLVFDDDPASAEELAALLARWRTAAESLLARGAPTPRWDEVSPIAQALADASRIGQAALVSIADRKPPPAGWREAQLAALRPLKQLPVAVKLPALPSINLLVCAASEQDQRATMMPAAWRAHLQQRAAEAK